MNLYLFRYRYEYDVSLKVLFNSLSANITKWSNTLKQFAGKLPTHDCV